MTNTKRLLEIMVLLVMTVAIVTAAPVFIQPVHNQAFNITEDLNFVYMIMANDSGSNYPINFTDTSHDPEVGFYCFSKSQYNESSSLMNFTCDNSMVGDYTFNIIATSSIYEITAITVHFNLSNSNDVPMIVGNSSTLEVDENQTLPLWVLVHDDDLIHGDNLTFTWYLDDALGPKLVGWKVNSTYSEANYTPIIEDFDSGAHTVKVVVTDSGNTTANFTWNINVINVNRKPVFNHTIMNITWDEETNLSENITLRDYFFDLDTNGTLCEIDTGFCLEWGYDVVQGNPEDIVIYINQTSTNVSFSPKEDWFGTLNVSFWVFDNYNKTYSNNVTLTVQNINDAPRIEQIVNHTIWACTDFYYQVNATDVDNDTLTYYINCSTLPTISINSSTGLIVLLSNSSDAGNHTVNITVDDGLENSSTIFNLTVLPNERPVIIPFGNYSIQQYSTMTLIVNGSDLDSDNLTFWTNSSLLNPGQRFNGTAWNYTFTPINQTLVGNYSVRIWVNDTKGSINHYDFILFVMDKPMPPWVYPVSVPYNQLKINLTYKTTVYAFDEDGDIQLFSDNTSLFNITTISTGNFTTNATANISLTPNVTGLFYINISVNDSLSQVNYTILFLNITLNRPPGWFTINNMVCEEDELCSQLVVAQDKDWQDTILYGDNATDWDINPNTGLIAWTPTEQKNYTVDIWATDGTVNISYTIYVNITEIDDAPYFLQYIPNMSEWDDVRENGSSYFGISAADEEYNRTGDLLTLTVSFINFTDQANITYNTSNLFDFVSFVVNPDNTTTGYLNFTPGQSDVGWYWVNISVSDASTVVSEIFTFEVKNMNNPPIVDWTLNYPNGSLFIASNASLTMINATENKTLFINTFVTDPDFDPVTYRWEATDFEGTATIATTNDLDHTIPFTAYPNYSIVLTVKDAFGAETVVTWILSVTNVNRDIVFGMRRYTFNPAEETHNNTEIVNDTLVISLYNGTDYYDRAVFISDSMDFRTTSLDLPRIEYTNFSFRNRDNCTLPGFASVGTINGSNMTNATNTTNTTNISYCPYNVSVFTSTTNQLFENIWDPLLGMQINSSNYRYLKFRFDINSSNTSVTPIIDDIKVYVEIHNLTVGAESEYAAWLDLRDFFLDPDEDDTITYDYIVHTGNALINVSLLSNYFVRIQFQEPGNAELQFFAYDQYNSTAFSNIIDILIESSGSSTSDTGEDQDTGSSSSSRTRTKTKTETETEFRFKEKKEPIALDLIHPDEINIYENETIIIPIILQNNDQFDLTGLSISAITDRDGLDISLDRSKIGMLPRGATDMVTLTVFMNKVYDSYSVFLTVNVTEPVYYDTAKILITSLKKARDEETAEKLKLAFVADLLEENEVCAELSEYIRRAKEYYDLGNIEKGNELLDQFVNDCKILIKQSAGLQDEPSSLLGSLYARLSSNTDYLLLAATVAAVVLITTIASLVTIYRKI